MLKILKSEDQFVRFTLSGRIETEHLRQLEVLLDAEKRPVILDLKEVTLVDREVIGYLARCEANGVRLENCAAYILDWIQRQREQS